MKVPAPHASTEAAIFASYVRARASEPARDYLGASVVGHACVRKMWLDFRWTAPEKFDGRMLRLFETGNIQERRVITDLKAIGCTVWDIDGSTGKQFRYQAFGGHFSAGLDGVVLGIPEAPKTPHLLEVKTHNAKSFAALVKKGVGAANPAHFMQMQACMSLAHLDRALYVAVNKDTDDIYTERVHLDPLGAERVLMRAEEAIFSSTPPAKLSDDPKYFECGFCPSHALCHGTEAPAVSCRTCAHATPQREGGWHCEHHDKPLTVDEQHAGCTSHRHMPKLLENFALVEDADPAQNTISYRNKANGLYWYQPLYSSAEVTDCRDKTILGDKVVDEFKVELQATIAPRNSWSDMVDDLPWEKAHRDKTAA